MAGRRRIRLLLAFVVGAGALVPVASGQAVAAVEPGRPSSGASELSAEARVMSTDHGAALEAYWTEERRATAEQVELPTLTEEEAGRGEQEPAGEPGRSVRRQASPPGPRPVEDPSAVSGFGDLGQPWPYRGDEPATTIGRVYYYDATAKKNKWCSATVVDADSNRLVWTAGHCIHGGGSSKKWHQNWIFYPHYRNGVDPAYGWWYAEQLWSWSKWIDGGNYSYDFGAAVMAPKPGGQRIASVTGGQGLAWNYSKNGYVHNFGYPAEWPFNGMTLQYCFGGTWASGADVGMKCNMTGGASGGPWLGWFDGWNGWVNGNNSYKITWDPTRMFSPYYGNAVGNLYSSVQWR
ncbi:trypsin-like serine peptidase [Phytohabitans aurantiacus]|uniref:trypsin-like serine peptidase n=1 Tax=Phytohabitans aurantiacus TaxID=3016789 RepID=UPI002491F0A0|nr:hypothetical protein [Phytohabitans aurantiacus]